ncbi:class I SAM-dependent methyltransferase [Streptomyces sp. NBC_00201]|uniref:class I SAM-dependent methyltransferase n=1 Tax=unclassified Streptomyces TaxID=2593676 RepID=UPI002253D066|nr:MULTISPECIES: class I SAM-dependent methyltransferase [unclassified Streptomyces]MCX5059809.1 class I SAM-dependent methyltransferase [Streptomyces sp. NBC_00452]MCX5252410.1 class I SAM-dependent methyltransferase [Streptomyces sp. NBC_00201]MCX5290721.1 class I SAM-dependent methyltransferase [Streptomyces sp. NBC_00183]
MTALRKTFNEDAELYDRARPRYPRALVDELTRATGLGPGSRVLEIGPGTGQLTVSLAEFGCRVIAVELGDAMAEVARQRLSAFPRVEVRVAEFEAWELPEEPFDLVVCATAFHWIDPAVRVVKAARALRPGGRLALVVTDHVAGGTTEFFTQAQSCYERWDPATPPGLRLLPASEIPTDSGELERSPHFERVVATRHIQDITYTTDQYIDVLLTYSGHRALEETARQGLLTCLRRLIETRHGGTVTKRYLHDLIVATRVGE